MKKRTLGALALALCFALSLFAVPAAADAPAATGAEEVIYAKLDAAGEPLSAYAVVALNGDAGESVTHYGAYTAVENLTDTSALTYEDGAVTATIPEGGRLYYQGTLESFELPWDIAIGYELDGKSISPAELGGQSGALEMTLSVKPNGNAPGAFADEMMLQITVTLDASLCKDISAGGATVANAGGDKTLAFTVLPGAEAEYTVTADVEDFTMAGLTIAGVNYDIASAMGDTAEMKAIKSVFGPSPKAMISSTKAITGHGLSLAGVMEAAFCALSMKEGFTPGSAHISEPDPETEGLDIITETQMRSPDISMSLSSGFGGANVAIVLQKA